MRDLIAKEPSLCNLQFAIGDGLLWTTCKRKAKPEAQLGDRRSQSDEPRRVGCGKSPQVGTCPLDTHDAPFFASGAVFFRRSRLFFREAAFSSGGEGCEWGAKQPTVGESGDKAENEFSGFIPLVVPRKGFSPHIPASRLFVLFHPSKATISPIHPKPPSLPSIQSHHLTHPSKPHQIKQPLSKRAVNERAVAFR